MKPENTMKQTNQNTLFPDSQTFQKDRPTKPTEKQKEAFYLKMAQEIINNNWSLSSADSIAKDLERISPFSDNGYELAKKLEGFYPIRHINVTDYLRSIGIALPFMGYSVEELIELGWCKLKEV